MLRDARILVLALAVSAAATLGGSACGGDDSSQLPSPDGGASGASGNGGSKGGAGGQAGSAAGAAGTGGGLPPVCEPAASPEGFFASPDGTAAGDGSKASPWDLQTALSQPASLVPGSRLWLRGGTYHGSFTSSLQGTADLPIVVRSHPGELATIDGAGSSDATLSFNGRYTWLWGVEVTNSAGNHSFGDRPNGLNINGKFVKLINSFIHDGAGNFMYGPMTSPDADGEGLEMYGNLFFLQGVNPQNEQDRAHGHAIYSQNFQGKKLIHENLVFNGFSWGVHCYAENTQKYVIDGFDFVGNVTFNTNAAQSGPLVAGNDFLVGGDQGVYAAHILVKENFSWAHGPSNSVKLGYGSTQNKDIEITDNHFAGGFQVGLWDSVTMHGNTVYGASSGFDPAAYPDNSYETTPTGVHVFVRPNAYEPGRAHVIVYNFDGVESVEVDLSKALAVGSTYEVRNAQAPFGAPVVQGVFDGKPVVLPVVGLHPQQPVGLPDAILPEDETGKTFNVFLVIGCK